MHTGLLAGLRVAALALVVQAGAIVVAMAQAPTAGVVAPDPIEGVWQTVLLSEITIAACPEGFCGALSKIIVPGVGLTPEELAAAQAMDPATFTDMRNKDPELRNRPMLGLQILTLLPSTKPNIYDGEIYNPQDGNTYSGYVEMTGPDVARLNGCVLFNVVCKGEDWVRAPPPVAEE
ncbi:uncharacterized protein (DUF2147 family) [Devosia sp. UYZn731]|uniref:DUF2147 domain-containing protein n=1 Tax=Devosia sp. UYZn731 TaxID=3156345 RepID=UPI003394077D